MNLSPFLAACGAAADVHLTHFLCVTPEGIAARYAAPPYRMDTLRLCYSMTKSFTSLAKIAQMLLNGGAYGGQQLVPAAYLDLAAAVQIKKQDHDPEAVYGGAGYGFQFHIGKNGYFRMDGAFGQVCLICPQKQLAFVALSSGSKTESLLRLIYTHFLEDAPPFSAGIYRMEENPMHIRTLTLSGDWQDGTLALQTDTGVPTLRFRLNGETCGRTVFIKDLQTHEQTYVCRAAWQDGLELTVHYIETPYIVVYRMSFLEKAVRLDFQINVSFTLKDFAAVGILCT